MKFIVDEPVRGYCPGADMLPLSGVDRLRGLITGDIPPSPIAHLTGLRITHGGFGSCTAVMPASRWFQTQAGFFLNGVSAIAADYALGGAIMSVLPAWTFPVTSDINFTYLRPILVGSGTLIAQARLIEAGRTQATAEVTVLDGLGRLLTHGTTRCFVQGIEPTNAVFSPPPQVSYTTPDPYERPVPDAFSHEVDLSALTGLEIVEKIGDGSLPAPWTAVIGGPDSYVSEQGRFEGRFSATPWFSSSAGTLFGGMLAAIADGLISSAATTILEAGTATASLDLKVHFLRPGIADESRLVGRGHVIHSGKGLIVCHTELSTEAGKTLVTAVGSLMRRSLRDWIPVDQ